MKKIILLTLLATLCFTDSWSQSKKELRRIQREAQIAKEKQFVDKAVKNQNFTYVATTISSSSNVMINNIRLNSLYTVAITPKSLKCYLPIYGTSGAGRRPSLVRRLDLFTSDFTYEYKPLNKGGWFVKINCDDNRSGTKYIFEFNITQTGAMTSLNVSTSFDPSVTFSGDIRE